METIGEQGIEQCADIGICGLNSTSVTRLLIVSPSEAFSWPSACLCVYLPTRGLQMRVVSEATLFSTSISPRRRRL